MFENILCKAVSAIRQMNQWWDKDEDKAIASVIAGLIILLGILIFNKGILFLIALFLVSNRILHRCNVWTMLECDISESEVSSEIDKKDDLSD